MTGYHVLQTDLMTEAARASAAAVVAFLRTDVDALALAGHDGYTCEVRDQHGRVVCLLQHGIEIAMLFKRQTAEVPPGEADPVPEKVVKDEDVWLVVDLLKADEPTIYKGIASKLRRLMEELRELKKDERK